MPRPRTVQEFYQRQHPDNDWSDFKPTTPDSLAPVHAAIQETWERPWELDVYDAPIALDRTNQLGAWNARIGCSVDGVVSNVHDGVPFAYADGETKYPIFRTTNVFTPPQYVPMPNPVPRLGDPTGFMSDLQYFGIDRLGLWELSSIGPAWWRGFPFNMGADMAAHNITRWFYSKNWYEQKTGMTGGKNPFLPMLPSYEELENGIDHALHLVILYGQEDHVYPARNSDDIKVRRKGMPLRAGERLRLRLTVDELQARMGRRLTRQELNVVRAMQIHGVIVDDVRPAPEGRIRMPMDHRVDVDLLLFLVDFVVLMPIAREMSPGYRLAA